MRIAAEDIIGMLYRAEESAAQHESASPTLLHEPAEALRGFVGWLAIRRLMVDHEIHATSGGALELTNSGREMARSVVRSHRLWETYLGEQTELPLDHLHAPAERMEHFIGPQLQEQIAAELTSSDIGSTAVKFHQSPAGTVRFRLLRCRKCTARCRCRAG